MGTGLVLSLTGLAIDVEFPLEAYAHIIHHLVYHAENRPWMALPHNLLEKVSLHMTFEAAV